MNSLIVCVGITRCKKNQAKYSCPECNIPYCSLDCYRSPEHRACSEGFYKSAIEEEIRSNPERSIEEKRSMLEILQRLQESDVLDGPPDSDDEGASEDGGGLESLNIETADSTALWSALSPAQREAFEKAMRDPDSSLARQLLDTITSESPHYPWWEQTKGDQPPPSPLQVPSELAETAQKGWKEDKPRLLYNIVAICLAYAWVIRTLRIYSISSAGPHDEDACRDLLARAVPFLLDRKSLTRLESAQEAVNYVQSRVGEPLDKILPDVAVLLRPLVIMELSSSSSSPMAPRTSNVTVCLGDIASLYEPKDTEQFRATLSTRQAKESSQDPKGEMANKGVVRKLIFYAAHVDTAPLEALRLISDRILSLSSRISQST
ncbi:SubName: Full=Uncharacterized protein {ECO:0000313/EMBL:CCA72458.1} [Serendipita indica DSM 11827]|uniref:HIT-type domain-containing protein n=1 Tax=Serendipita indica (strain DSM 11827) TaxID=1109443 RepID=G4TMB7_SERID|nr:SubName: Full=Uncharacterized protein {ECO:0000313/EMBL:CCA72458.1} [Serendipita indica DSM 11827]CCA72458.1 hypothetical protein PIIN_06394 [Serendipita indica DSM 11827]